MHESQPNILGAIMQASSHLQHFTEQVKPNSPIEEPPQLGKNLQSPELFGPNGTVYGIVSDSCTSNLERLKKVAWFLADKHWKTYL